MLTATTTRYAMLTDVGRVRGHNEDACAADPAIGVFVVCDGMGGAAGGEIASHDAAGVFLATARQRQLEGSPCERLDEAVRAANRAVYQRAISQPRLRGMGTTIVALEVLTPQEGACVVHAGDSRCYRLRDGSLERLTQDHSLVEEQVRHGAMTEAQARQSHLRNVITRVVGSHARVEPEVALHSALPGDVFLLCSDGLTRDLTDFDLRSILNRHKHNLAHAARVLVDAANLLGGGDNITVLLVAVDEPTGLAV